MHESDFRAVSPVFGGLVGLFKWMKHNGWQMDVHNGDGFDVARLPVTTTHQIVISAGFTIHETVAAGFYALPPTVKEFVHEDDRHNYLGFFSSLDDLVDEVSEEIAEKITLANGWTASAWEHLSPAQQIAAAANCREIFLPGKFLGPQPGMTDAKPAEISKPRRRP